MGWVFNTSEIGYGKSAILGGNKVAFYTIHYFAIGHMSISILASVTVIISIILHKLNSAKEERRATLSSFAWHASQNKQAVNFKRNSYGFTERFPLYLAICDCLWLLAHMADHIALLWEEVYPPPLITTILGSNMWFFCCYQQLLQSCLGVYAYLKIVRGVRLNLGKYEWKLHLFCAGTISLSICVIVPFGAYGHSGFWIAQDVTTTAGKVLGWYVTCFAVTNISCIIFCYASIRHTTLKQKEEMAQVVNFRGGNPYSTASKCLMTFILVAGVVYLPWTVVFTIHVVETSIFEITDSATMLVIAILGNSVGWANCLAYFHNRKVKREANKAVDSERSLQTIAQNF